MWLGLRGQWSIHSKSWQMDAKIWEHICIVIAKWISGTLKFTSNLNCGFLNRLWHSTFCVAKQYFKFQTPSEKRITVDHFIYNFCRFEMPSFLLWLFSYWYFIKLIIIWANWCFISFQFLLFLFQSYSYHLK